MSIQKKDIIRSKFAGDFAVTTTTVNLRSGPGTNYSSIKLLPKGYSIGYVVGFYRYKTNGYTWYLFRLYDAIAGHTVGWVADGYFSHHKINITRSGTKKMLKDLVANDIIIYKRLLTGLVVLNRLRKMGYDVSAYYSIAKQLTKRYNARQKLLRETNALHVIDYGSTAYKKIRNYLVQSGTASGQQWGFRGLGELGAAPVAIALAVGAIIGIAVSITLYYLFKPKYDESTKDLKISAALKKALDTLPEDQRKQVTANLEKQIDDAYNQGKTDQVLSSIWSVGKYVVAGVIVYKGVELITQKQNQPQAAVQS